MTTEVTAEGTPLEGTVTDANVCPGCGQVHGSDMSELRYMTAAFDMALSTFGDRIKALGLNVRLNINEYDDLYKVDDLTDGEKLIMDLIATGWVASQKYEADNNPFSLLSALFGFAGPSDGEDLNVPDFLLAE